MARLSLDYKPLARATARNLQFLQLNRLRNLARRREADAHAALAVGMVVGGLMAIGALAIARVVTGKMAIGRLHLRRLEIDELAVHRVNNGVGTEHLPYLDTEAEEPEDPVLPPDDAFTKADFSNEPPIPTLPKRARTKKNGAALDAPDLKSGESS